LQEIVRAGTLGTITSAQMVCRSWSIPPRPPADAPRPAGWRTRPEQAGGGALTDVGAHRLDLLFWLFGDALAVSANVERIATWLETEDQANVAIRFANGVVGSLDQSWCSRSYRDSIVVYGTEGIATVPDLEGTRLELQRGAATEAIEVAPRSAATHRPLVTDFVRALNGDRRVRCSGADALRTTQIIELAYRASREGSTLGVPPLVSR
jgi:predicted dehydrogenase